MYYSVNCKACHKFATCLLIYSGHLCEALVVRNIMQRSNQEHNQRLELRFSQNKKAVLGLLEIFKAYFNNQVGFFKIYFYRCLHWAIRLANFMSGIQKQKILIKPSKYLEISAFIFFFFFSCFQILYNFKEEISAQIKVPPGRSMQAVIEIKTKNSRV